MGKVKDAYIENVSKKIVDLIKEEAYLIAGSYFMEMCHYGIEIRNELLVFLSSELSDIYRNSLIRVKEFGTISDKGVVDEIKLKTFKLIEFMCNIPDELSSEKKTEIFELLKFIIFHAERMQYETGKKDIAQSLYKRRLIE